MTSSVKAIVKPALLIWARENSGLSITDVAKKLNVKPQRVESWEKGENKPTVRQLRMLANIFKRPLAVFYLPKPPKDFEALHDFRRLPVKIDRTESPELRYEIRWAQYRRQVALDLLDLLGESAPKFPHTITPVDDPENIALRLRKLIGIDITEQTNWNNEYEALRNWKFGIENLGILVFQASKINVKEMRGFSISKTRLPVIVLNVQDTPKGRIFTMLHELTHLMLHQNGLCNLFEKETNPTNDDKIEIFCNRVAGATLIPMQQLVEDDIVQSNRERTDWDNMQINRLSQRYRTSREVVLRRLLIAQRTTLNFYRNKIADYQKEYEAMQKKVGGFALPHVKAISSAGNLFTNLVLSSYHQEKITSSSLSDYLNVRLKHIPKIEAEIRWKKAK